MTDLLIVLGTIAIYFMAFMFAITFHEIGHFIAARIFGIKVESFSVGYGKELWSFVDKHGTKWKFKLFCVAGHIHLSGEDRFKKTTQQRPRFSQLSLFRRFLTVLAGPLFGFLLPFLILPPAYYLMGQPHYYPVINSIQVGKAADQAGIQLGDKILSINDEKITGNRQTRDFFRKLPPEPLDLIVERDGQNVAITLIPFEAEYRDQRGLKQHHARVGVHLTNMPGNLFYVQAVNGIPTDKNIDTARQLIIDHLDQDIVLTLDSYTDEEGKADYHAHISSESNQGLFDEDDEYHDFYFPGTRAFGFYADLNLGEAVKLGFKESATIIQGIFGIPLQYFPVDREKLKPYSHPSRDASETKYWIFSMIHAVVLLSVALGFINLLPFPGLDGSYLLYYAAESIKGPEFVSRHRGTLIAASLFIIYLIVLSANIDDIIPYMEAMKERISDKAQILKQTKI